MCATKAELLRQKLSASAIASPAVQDIGGIGINQHGESIAKTIRLAVNRMARSSPIQPPSTRPRLSRERLPHTSQDFRLRCC